MRSYVQAAVYLWLLVTICGASDFNLQHKALHRRGSGSGSRSPSPHHQDSGGNPPGSSRQGSQEKGKGPAHPQSSGTAHGRFHPHPLHLDLNQPPTHEVHPAQSHHGPVFQSHPPSVHSLHPVQAHAAHLRHPLQAHLQRPVGENPTAHLLSKQSAAQLASSLHSGSKRPAEATQHPQMGAKQGKEGWWNTPGGRPKRGPVAGTRPAWWNKVGGQPRRQSGTGPRYEQNKAAWQKQKELKKQQQGSAPSEHHEHHPKPGGPRGPGSPGSGSHAVSKRRLRFH